LPNGILKKESLDFTNIAKKAYNLASTLKNKLNMHYPTIYAIYINLKPGRATTILMTSLRPKTQKKEPLSTFWK
jgi:hypothetical protein